MVDVRQHKVFPTIINEFEFDMDKQEHDLVIDELNDMEKYDDNNLILPSHILFLYAGINLWPGTSKVKYCTNS